MATIKKFEDLEIWQRSRSLCKKIYLILQYADLAKDYKLKDQINGSSGSIMDNIAEGFDRDGNKEFKIFLSYSKGSCSELKSQLYRALDREYITQQEFDTLYEELAELSKMIASFMNYLGRNDYAGNKFKPN